MAFILILIFRITDGISFKQKNYITETIQYKLEETPPIEIPSIVSIEFPRTAIAEIKKKEFLNPIKNKYIYMLGTYFM